ncbi:hypothetical protein H4219_003270 [Mycoemilia scoparia]|uniref:RING-type E3 ubiquitin transferase n=1 Tax=Mycoemilia scoparia TaxID=417184 RepID=A0A9W7ZVC2_9FUNG|nr:hypothetical protein H4219_003270 [Mycoemilia scoparia]
MTQEELNAIPLQKLTRENLIQNVKPAWLSPKPSPAFIQSLAKLEDFSDSKDDNIPLSLIHSNLPTHRWSISAPSSYEALVREIKLPKPIYSNNTLNKSYTSTPVKELPTASPMSRSFGRWETISCSSVKCPIDPPTEFNDRRKSGDKDSHSVLECSICLDEMEIGDTIRELPCDHRYHSKCLDKWLLTQSTRCPLCKADIKTYVLEKETQKTSDSNSGST